MRRDPALARVSVTITIVDRHDRRVLQASGDQRLAHEPAARGLVGSEQLLDGDRTREHLVARAHLAAEATAPDLGSDDVAIGCDLREHVLAAARET